MAYNRYPYTDYNNLNVDWIIEQVKANEDSISRTVEDMNDLEAALESEERDRAAAVADLQNQIDNIEVGKAAVLDRRPNVNQARQVVFVTDSFGSFPSADGGNPDTSFVETAAGYLNLAPGNFQKIYKPRSGFYVSDASLRFRTMIEEAIITLTPDEVTDFVFVGGNNDLGAPLDQVRGQIIQCCQWVAAGYPNARVWVIFDAWRAFSGPDGNASQVAQKAYQEGAAMEGATFATAAPALHGTDLVKTEDGLHPTPAGVIALAKCVSEILAGSPNPTGGRTWALVEVTPGIVVTNVERGWMINSYNGDFIEVYINPGYTWTVNSTSWRAIGGNMWYDEGRTFYDVGTVTAAFFNSPSAYPYTFIAPCTFDCVDSGPAHMDGYTMIRFTGGHVYATFFGDAMRNAGTANEGWAKISKVHFKGGSYTLSALNN